MQYQFSNRAVLTLLTTEGRVSLEPDGGTLTDKEWAEISGLESIKALLKTKMLFVSPDPDPTEEVEPPIAPIAKAPKLPKD